MVADLPLKCSPHITICATGGTNERDATEKKKKQYKYRVVFGRNKKRRNKEEQSS